MNIYSTSKKIESPLNYIGSKFEMVDFIKEKLPHNINTFYDIFAGGFNVGINIENCKNVSYNDYNIYLKEIIEIFLTKNINEILLYLEKTIDRFKLIKKDKSAYQNFRNYYNSNKPGERNPLDLYILILYGFNHQIRFNNKHDFNNPTGTSGFNLKNRDKIINFNNQKNNMTYSFTNLDFRKFIEHNFDKNDFIYCDPPYLITLGSYNDGKRGFSGWDKDIEIDFLNFLYEINEKGIKFMLSNILEHKGKKNELLSNWIKKNNFNIIEYDDIIKSKRKELLVINY